MFRKKEWLVMVSVLAVVGVSFYFLSGTYKMGKEDNVSDLNRLSDAGLIMEMETENLDVEADYVNGLVSEAFDSFDNQTYVSGSEQTVISFSDTENNITEGSSNEFANNNTEFYIFDNVQIVRIKADDSSGVNPYNELLMKITKDGEKETKEVYLNKTETTSSEFINSFSSISLSKYRDLFNKISECDDDSKTIEITMNTDGISSIDMSSTDISVMDLSDTYSSEDIEDFTIRVVMKFENNCISSISQTYSIEYKNGGIMTTNVKQEFSYENKNEYTAEMIFDDWYYENKDSFAQVNNDTVEESSNIVTSVTVYSNETKFVVLDTFTESLLKDCSVKEVSDTLEDRTFQDGIIQVKLYTLEDRNGNDIEVEVLNDTGTLTSVSLTDFDYNSIVPGMKLSKINKILSDLGYTKVKNNQKDNIITYKSGVMDICVKIALDEEDCVNKLTLSVY